MTPQPDFLRPVRGPHPLAWVACVTAFAVLGVAAFDAWQAWQQQQAPVAAVAVRAAAPAAPSRTELDARRSLQQAVLRLDRPWPATFAALEAVDAPGVAWLVLEIGDGGRLRLQGQAADARAAMRAAEALRGQGLWRDALLGRMDAAAGAALRFEITAEALQ